MPCLRRARQVHAEMRRGNVKDWHRCHRPATHSKQGYINFPFLLIPDTSNFGLDGDENSLASITEALGQQSELDDAQHSRWFLNKSCIQFLRLTHGHIDGEEID
jgi:hypothetical protein